ncbi:hypothetical protein ABTY00_35060 [Streptomyces microflavus]|uniref:hypothetical protein n=1 Tax=Streptomyces microflavus TaxID=1919 RepID=UPI003317F6B7
MPLVYLDDPSTDLAADWLRERRRRWPQATNPHLLVTPQTYRHPASPPISHCAMRSAFDQIGLLPRQHGPTASWRKPGRPPIRST